MLSVLLKNMHIEPLRMTVTAWVLGLIGLGGSAPLRAVDFTVVVENPLGHKWPHELLTLPLTAAQHEAMQRMDAQTHALVVTCNGFTVPAQLHAGPGGQPLMSWLVRDRVTSKQGHEQFAFHVQAVEKKSIQFDGDLPPISVRYDDGNDQYLLRNGVAELAIAHAQIIESAIPLEQVRHWLQGGRIYEKDRLAGQGQFIGDVLIESMRVDVQPGPVFIDVYIELRAAAERAAPSSVTVPKLYPDKTSHWVAWEEDRRAQQEIVSAE